MGYKIKRSRLYYHLKFSETFQNEVKGVGFVDANLLHLYTPPKVTTFEDMLDKTISEATANLNFDTSAKAKMKLEVLIELRNNLEDIKQDYVTEWNKSPFSKNNDVTRSTKHQD